MVVKYFLTKGQPKMLRTTIIDLHIDVHLPKHSPPPKEFNIPSNMMNILGTFAPLFEFYFTGLQVTIHSTKNSAIEIKQEEITLSAKRTSLNSQKVLSMNVSLLKSTVSLRKQLETREEKRPFAKIGKLTAKVTLT
jgi:hypothetical protein